VANATLTSSLTYQAWDLSGLLINARLAKAVDEGSAGYPIYRSLRFAARTELEALFDQLATSLNWRGQRLGDNTLILEGDSLFIVGHGGLKSAYCSCSFSIWARDAAVASEAIAAILRAVGEARIQEPMFSIDWYFLSSKGELRSTSIEEMADDQLIDSAYPELKGGVKSFIARYLDAPETVLVLQGAPGSGKTRLIRSILGEMSRRGKGNAEALYTGDKKALESDEIFVEFITGRHNAFIVEDADHHLKPRAKGNEHLHRFLTIADGIVRAQGRKIIFSTNLPNIGDLDDALIRPGRCHARIATRELTLSEAKTLATELCRASGRPAEPVIKRFVGDMSLAEIYQAVQSVKID
jgi:SpoVK/Ycf46/Vps4 family AAA+-type ATPase